MSINIKSYHPLDYTKVRSILRQRGLYEPRRDTFQDLQRRIAVDPESILVAKDGKKVMGVVYVLTDGAIISHLAVHPTYQNRGIGELLMRAAEEKLSRAGSLEASIMVLENLVPFHESREYQRQQGTYVWMTKTLKPHQKR